ncbi:leucine-rich repeat protein [Corallincola spongiicola]|uniref:Receptor L-domain domain-containing protein n=1 Tax=Corallincola spongiicola TaxID=2520508 RepID=A0ABY1WLY3_9GAMM|nr:leucine-rich repeat protein [Corallincola spongiicola]TAA42587.1 hypothetical protein EXY25_14955 [Corallincola spongiicola]
MLLLTVGMLIGHSSDSLDFDLPPPDPNPDPCSDELEGFNYCINGESSAETIAAMQGIEIIEGTLFISNTGLTDLSGLESLRRINGNLFVEDDDSLTSLKGLDNLEYVGERLGIISVGLTDLSGLESLITVDGDLTVFHSHRLANLGGLDNLEYIGGLLAIAESSALVDMTGLGAVETIEQGIQLNLNNSLVSLIGLNSLKSLPGGLWVAEQPIFSSLEGLSGVSGIMNTLSIDNAPVASLQPLSQLSAISDRISLTRTFLDDLSGLQQIEPFTGALIIEDLVDHPLSSAAQLPVGDSLTALFMNTLLTTDEWPNFSYLVSVSEGVSLSVGTMADLGDAFPLLQSVDGQFHISDVPDGVQCEDVDATDINLSFNSLVSIAGDFSISSECHTRLFGFDALESVEEKLSISGGINKIPEFPALQRIAGLDILAPVSDLSAFNGVQLTSDRKGREPSISIEGTNIVDMPALLLPVSMSDLFLENNARLTHVDLQGGSDFVVRTIEIRSNDELISFSSFESLISITNIIFSMNPQLVNIDAFYDIDSANRVTIDGNPKLTSLAMFNNIETLQSSVDVRQNDTLSDFGFEALTVVDGDFVVTGNSLLCQSEIESLVENQITVAGEVNVSDNQEVCE